MCVNMFTPQPTTCVQKRLGAKGEAEGVIHALYDLQRLHHGAVELYRDSEVRGRKTLFSRSLIQRQRPPPVQTVSPPIICHAFLLTDNL